MMAVTPAYESLLARAGLRRPEDILSLSGTAITLRPLRQVRRVALPGGVHAFLKTESLITTHQRLESWWGGFGWVSRSVREGRLLSELKESRIPCPDVMAFGESATHAFVMVREVADRVPLVDALRDVDDVRMLLGPLGRELAHLHEAGFDHPDLFAKHILVCPNDGSVCLLDWQRTRRRRSVSWSRRVHDLALLDASLAEKLLSRSLRRELWQSYLSATTPPRPALDRMIQAIASRAWLLLQGRRIRRMRDASLAACSAPPGGTRHLAPLTEMDARRTSLLHFLRLDADKKFRWRILRRSGRVLRELHEAGYPLARSSLASWAVTPTRDSDADVILTGCQNIRPTAAPSAGLRRDDLAWLLAHHGSTFTRCDQLRFLDGYLGNLLNAREFIADVIRHARIALP